LRALVLAAGALAPLALAGETPARPAGNVPVVIIGRVATHTVQAGRPAIITGRITYLPPGAGSRRGLAARVRIDLRNYRWPQYNVTFYTRAKPTGNFTAKVWPRVNAAVQISFPGDPQLSAARSTPGRIRVRPHITAAFSATGGPRGTLQNIRVAGTFAPKRTPRLVHLTWEAQVSRTSPWYAICPVGASVTVRKGRFTGGCKLAGLKRNLRFRLRYTPGPGSPYLGTISAAHTAKLR
jgi:hypothetical protein